MLEVSNIKKSYGRKNVLEQVSFHAGCGECVAIVGRNGCGKTTLMQILAGVIRPDKGELRYFGKNPLSKKNYFHKLCGYVPQELPLMEELSVKDNLRLWGVSKKKEDQELIHEFQLEELMRVTVAKLSGGMKRRLSIACALAEWPPILLMDEPSTALDLYSKEQIGSWIKKYCEMDGIVVMATHDEREILSCGRCLLMKEGRLRELPKEEMDIGHIKEMLA